MYSAGTVNKYGTELLLPVETGSSEGLGTAALLASDLRLRTRRMMLIRRKEEKNYLQLATIFECIYRKCVILAL